MIRETYIEEYIIDYTITFDSSIYIYKHTYTNIYIYIYIHMYVRILVGKLWPQIYLWQILGAFAKLGKGTITFVMPACLSNRPSVRPHATFRLPLDGFS